MNKHAYIIGYTIHVEQTIRQRLPQMYYAA